MSAGAKQWERPIESDVDIDSPEWEWVKTPLVQVMTEVEKWGVQTSLLAVERRGNVVRVKAHYPPDMEWDKRWVDAGCPPSGPPKFESKRLCVECHRVVGEPHDIDCCRVRCVMES